MIGPTRFWLHNRERGVLAATSLLKAELHIFPAVLVAPQRPGALVDASGE